MFKVNCASGNSAYDFFEIPGQFAGAEEGTPLNNFLAAKEGKEGLVILDEFEKSGPDFHEALLNPFGSGKYFCLF